MRFPTELACLSLLSLASHCALGTPVVWDDGLTHLVNAPLVADIQLSGGTTVDIAAGGAVIGNIQAQDGHVKVSGGTLLGNAEISGNFTITDGTVTGGVGAFAQSTVSIHGGSILGGVTVDNEALVMTGGYVSNSFNWIFADLLLTGGVVDASLWSDAPWDALITGGLITGGLTLGGDFQGEDRDGDHIITGGMFTGSRLAADTPLVSLYTDLDIYGGSFVENSFLIGQWGILNLYGSNLRLRDGYVTGYLADGSYLNQRILLEGNGVLNIYNVPEPAPIGLLSAALLSFMFRRKRTAPH